MGTLSENAQDLLGKLGIEKTVRECYKHSVHQEVHWRVQKLFSDRETRKTDIEGFEIHLDRFGKGIDKDLWLHGTRESESVEILESELEEDMLCVDIGANIGYYAMLESRLVGSNGEVLAIEPIPETIERLKQNISENNLENVEIVEGAVSDREEGCKIVLKDESNMNRVLAGKESERYNRTEDADSIRIQEILDTSPDFIRMDLEGFEARIIEQVVDSDFGDLKLFMEVHPRKIEKLYEGDMEKFLDTLSKNGFRIKYLIQHGDRIKPSYFLREKHPPRKVEKLDTVPENMDKAADKINTDRAFRAFLER